VDSYQYILKLHIAYRDTASGVGISLRPLNGWSLGLALGFFKLFGIAIAMAKWAKEKFWVGFRSILNV
jgi:hypothetical protein